jgi:hypothetical protein
MYPPAKRMVTILGKQKNLTTPPYSWIFLANNKEKYKQRFITKEIQKLECIQELFSKCIPNNKK